MLHLLFVYKTTRWSINNFKHGNDNALNKLFKDAERNETDSQQGMTMNFARTCAPRCSPAIMTTTTANYFALLQIFV